MDQIMVRQAVTRGMVVVMVAILGMCGIVVESYGSILPQDLIVSDTFEPGMGSPIGKVQRIKGEVVIVHSRNKKEGYYASKGLFLYKGDTVMTLEKSKIRFKLNDGSILSLASETKLELNKSVYDKKKKSRSSFLNMTFGKARFLVVKLLNFKRSEFKVKTPTAVCGVRGSDFVIEATADVTSTTAFEDTELEIISLVDPDAEPMVLKDFEMSKVFLGEYPTEPVRLQDEEIRQMKEVFINVSPSAQQGTETGDEEGTQEEESDSDETPEVAEDEVPVLVSDDDIGELPDTGEMMEIQETPNIAENIENEGVDAEIGGGSFDQQDLRQDLVEGELIGDIPDFPTSPE